MILFENMSKLAKELLMEQKKIADTSYTNKRALNSWSQLESIHDDSNDLNCISAGDLLFLTNGGRDSDFLNEDKKFPVPISAVEKWLLALKKQLHAVQKNMLD